MKLNGTNVPLNPVVSVPKHLKADVVANLTKQLKTPPRVISPEDMGTFKHHRRNSMPATSTMSLKALDRFDTGLELDNPATPRGIVCFEFLKVLYSSTSIILLTN